MPRYNARLPSLAIFCALLVALAAALLLVRPLDTALSLIGGASDREVVAAFGDPELAADGITPFRWTLGASSLALPPQGTGDHTLMLDLAAPPGTVVPLTVRWGNTDLATIAVPDLRRRFTVLVPADRIDATRNSVMLASQTRAEAGTPRQLGVVFFGARLAAAPPSWLPPLQVLALAATTLVLGAALRALGAGRGRALVLLLFGAISIAMRHSDLRYTMRRDALLLTLGIALLALLLAALARGGALAEPAPAPRPLRDRRSVLLCVLLGVAALLPLARLYPLFASAIPGPPGDNFEYLWKLGWYADALVQRSSPAFVAQHYAPVGYELAHSELTPGGALLALPLTLALGPTLAYNLSLLVSLLLGCWFAALLALRLGANQLGALVAGLGIGLAELRIHALLSQLPIVGSHWVILAFYGVESYIQRRRAADALLAALAVTLAAWSSWYYGPTLLLVLALYVLLRVPFRRWRTTDLRALALGGLVLLALLAPYAQPTIQLRSTLAARVPQPAEIMRNSAQPIDLIQPSVYHALWGAAIARNDPGGIERVSLGIPLLVLAVVGLWRRRAQRAAWALAVVALASAVFSLGPQLAIGTGRIPLPAALLAGVPVIESIRVWSRVALFTLIAVGILAAWAFDHWEQTGRAARSALAALAVLVAIGGGTTLPTLSRSGPRPVDTWLAQQPGAGAVASTPDVFAGYNAYYARWHGRPIAIGYGSFIPRGAQAEIDAIAQFPAPNAIAAMRRLGVRFVVVPRSAPEPRGPAIVRVYRDETVDVYAVSNAGENP